MRGHFFCPLIKFRKGGCSMVTYGDMFTYTLVILGVINLVVQIMNMKKK